VKLSNYIFIADNVWWEIKNVKRNLWITSNCSFT